MNSKVLITLFLLYINISICYSHAVLYINTKSNDISNQNDPQNQMNVFSIHNEDNEISKKLKFRDDYTLYPGYGYYKYHIREALWLNAKYICELEGAHLAVINSQDEADMIIGILKTSPMPFGRYPDYLLLGFHDMYKRGEFVTVLGGLLIDSGYTKWEKDQPHNRNNENCGCMRFKTGALVDCYCHYPSGFMCEKEL